MVGLAWCVSFLSTVIAVLLAIHFRGSPVLDPILSALPAIFLGAAVLGAGLALGVGRTSRTSRIRQSGLLWFMLVVVVVEETVMLMVMAVR